MRQPISRRRGQLWQVVLMAACATAVSLVGVAPARAASVPACSSQVEHPATVTTPSAVRVAAISFTKRVEQLGVKSVSAKADALKAPWWTVGEHKCRWQGKTTMTYGGQLPKGVAMGYRVLVSTKGEMASGGDALWLTIARVGGAWKIVSSGTSP